MVSLIISKKTIFFFPHQSGLNLGDLTVTQPYLSLTRYMRPLVVAPFLKYEVCFGISQKLLGRVAIMDYYTNLNEFR